VFVHDACSHICDFVPLEFSINTVEWLSLYNNNFKGSIPSNLSWLKMVYLDMGHNSLTGTIPSDWVDGSNTTTMIHLRTLYLDHNQLNGSLPDMWYNFGNGQIEQIVINDNLFTGTIPSSKSTAGNPNAAWDSFGNLTTLEIQNNAFTRFDKDLCRRSIYTGDGALAILHTDCGICDCNQLCPDSTQCSA
jgi:hypothetical protein